MINSFNELFAEAARRGLLLNNFFQNSDGVFRANWRRSTGGASNFVDNALPFIAARDSFLLAAYGSFEKIADDPIESLW
jgi:hypothetical protein